MTDKITLSDLENLQNETSATTTINNNSAAITTAFNNTLSRDGTSPNQMGANLDMNSHRVINLPQASSLLEPVRLQEFDQQLFTIQQVTSASSVTVALGSKTFVTSSDMSTVWSPGQFIFAFSRTSPSNYMAGQVSSISGTTLIVNVSSVGGSGTSTDWTIYQSGAVGPMGTLDVGEISYVFDGHGVQLATTGQIDLPITFACNIISWILVADQTGSVSVDLWNSALSAYPTSIANTIVNGNYPAISSARFNSSSSLGSWTTTSIAANSVLTAKVRSASAITRATLTLQISRG